MKRFLPFAVFLAWAFGQSANAQEEKPTQPRAHHNSPPPVAARSAVHSPQRSSAALQQGRSAAVRLQQSVSTAPRYQPRNYGDVSVRSKTNFSSIPTPRLVTPDVSRVASATDGRQVTESTTRHSGNPNAVRGNGGQPYGSVSDGYGRTRFNAPGHPRNGNTVDDTGAVENTAYVGRHHDGGHHGGGGRNDWNRHHHNRSWWRSHYTRFAFFGGGCYYWNSGYWYPAYGYDPYFSTYVYDAPLYSYNDLDPAEVIANVQTELQRLGYDPGPVDGQYGAATRQALFDYQRDSGLPVTGEIDEDTLDSLGLQ